MKPHCYLKLSRGQFQVLNTESTLKANGPPNVKQTICLHIQYIIYWMLCSVLCPFLVWLFLTRRKHTSTFSTALNACYLSFVFHTSCWIAYPLCHLDKCNSALGMGNFKIPPGSLLASRELRYWERYNARINDTVSGWCAGIVSDQEWFQIQFRTDHYITAVASQGTTRGFVLEFTLAYSRGLEWFDYKENGTIKVSINSSRFPVRLKEYLKGGASEDTSGQITMS